MFLSFFLTSAYWSAGWIWVTGRVGTTADAVEQAEITAPELVVERQGIDSGDDSEVTVLDAALRP
ncbi:MAG: hypothetical protein ACRD2W_02355 [Acidimicrobiales bacterium]